MVRLLSIGLAALFLASAAGCASESRSGAVTWSAPRTADRLDPVDGFPQARGASPYMRQ
jgi:hypothetical protein